MPLYSYKALTPAGKYLRGEITAASEQAALSRVEELGYLPVSATPVDDSRLQRLWRSLRRGPGLSRRQLELVTRELGRLMKAGVPVERALDLAADIEESEDAQTLLTGLRDRLREGDSLSQAIKAYEGTFPALYLSMVRAGEAAGMLGDSLERLANHLARTRELRSAVMLALIYPATLLVASIVAIMVLMTYVVPQFRYMFEGREDALPAITLITLGVADWLASNWILILFIVCLALLGVLLAWRRPAGRRRLEMLMTRLPWLGPLKRNVDMARFSRSIAALLSSGVGLLDALRIARDAASSYLMRDAITDCEERIERGDSFSQSALAQDHFPKLFGHMTRIGEETGKLDQILLDFAAIYDERIRESTRRFLALLEPALIVFLGVTVGGIMLSVLLAILSVYDLAV